ncbi:putative Invariant surface glycoprotein [Trypanosoma vivax]|nr:putative Invariant surface glycoprotein [Trypanosoma vivax]
MKVHGLDPLADAVVRTESKMTEAMRAANSTMEQVRRHNVTVFEAAALAEEERSDAVDGGGSLLGGFSRIFEWHCGSERSETSKRLRCQDCMKPLMEMFQTTGLECEQLGAHVARTTASVSAMTEALATRDEVRPLFAEEYNSLRACSCKPTPEHSCSVLEDCAAHFYTALRKPAEAEEVPVLIVCERRWLSTNCFSLCRARGGQAGADDAQGTPKGQRHRD